ncbi:cation transporter dimerization domain-containing protein, partial [Acinetobacter baumannii]
FHVWVDGQMTVAEAHRVMDEIESKLLAEFPGIEILIHPDPEGHVDAAALGPHDLLEPGPEGQSPATMVQGGPRH